MSPDVLCFKTIQHKCELFAHFKLFEFSKKNIEKRQKRAFRKKQTNEHIFVQQSCH